MKRFHIDLANDRGSFASDSLATTAGGRLISTVPNYDGKSDLAIIEIDDDGADYLCELMDGDDNVVSYRESDRAAA